MKSTNFLAPFLLKYLQVYSPGWYPCASQNLQVNVAINIMLLTVSLYLIELNCCRVKTLLLTQKHPHKEVKGWCWESINVCSIILNNKVKLGRKLSCRVLRYFVYRIIQVGVGTCLGFVTSPSSGSRDTLCGCGRKEKSP